MARQQVGAAPTRSTDGFRKGDHQTVPQFELYHDFTSKANGAVAAKADSGQTWTQTGNSGATPAIASGRFINPQSAAGSYGSYLTATLGATCTYMEANFDFGTLTGSGGAGTTNGGSVGLVAWVANLPSGVVTGTFPPDSPCHLTVSATQYNFGVWQTQAITNVGTVTFPPLGTATAHVEVFIDKTNSCAYVRGPDGAVNKFTHSAIGSMTAPYATIEPYTNAATTDKRAEVQQFAADSSVIGQQRFAAYKAQQIMLDYVAQNAVSQVYKSGGNIVIDPSFEDGSVWAGALGVNSTDQAQSGTQSRKLTAAGTFDTFNFLHDASGNSVKAPTNPARVYYIECYIRAKSGNTGTTQPIYIQPRSLNSAAVETSLATITIAQNTMLSTSAWTKFAAYAIMPSDAATFYVPIFVDSTVPVGDVFYVDSLMVQDVTEAYNITVGTTAINAKLAAGTTAAAPLKFQSGTALTTPAAGALEYDGATFSGTIDTTSGRALNAMDQVFRLAADGAALGATIADYFGANSAYPYVASGIYEIVWYLIYTKTTAGTVTYTITTTTTPTMASAWYVQTPVGGVGTAGTSQEAAIVKSTATATVLPATGSLTTAVNHQAEVHAIYEVGTAGNLRLRVTESAGTVTPLRGSFYRVRRLPSGNVGTFVA